MSDVAPFPLRVGDGSNGEPYRRVHTADSASFDYDLCAARLVTYHIRNAVKSSQETSGHASFDGDRDACHPPHSSAPSSRLAIL